jgi:hypothetical protein
MTIFLDKLRAVQTIVTHDSCADGTASALLLKDALPEAGVIFVQHGTDAFKTLPATAGMLFCDIAPPADRVDEFIAAGALVLDHHRTAKAIVERFGENGIFADEVTEIGVSGAMLAYREVWVPVRQTRGDITPWLLGAVENFATLTAIRDTWQNRDERWEAACKLANLMHFQPNTEWLKIPLATLMNNWADTYEWIGEVLHNKHAKAVTKTLGKSGHYKTPKGTRIVAMNSTSHTSDACEKLDQEADLIAGFAYEVENETEKMILSFRSHTGYNCSALARSLGGGGHTAAAGASVPVAVGESPYRTILRVVENFERG